MATVFDARYRRRHRLLTDASAGHRRRSSCAAEMPSFAELQPGPPIGFGVGAPQTHSLSLEPGDTVLLCTDGLYEPKRTRLDDSLETLRQHALRAAEETTTLDGFADMLLHGPISDTNDDACLIALRI